MPISMKVRLKQHNRHQRTLLCHPEPGTKTRLDTSHCANDTWQRQREAPVAFTQSLALAVQGNAKDG